MTKAYADFAPYHALWRAVLMANVGLSAKAERKDAGSTTWAEARAAKAWIGSKDFHIVCALAGLDGSYVLDRIKAGKFRHKLTTKTPQKLTIDGVEYKSIKHAARELKVSRRTARKMDERDTPERRMMQ